MAERPWQMTEGVSYVREIDTIQRVTYLDMIPEGGVEQAVNFVGDKSDLFIPLTPGLAAMLHVLGVIRPEEQWCIIQRQTANASAPVVGVFGPYPLTEAQERREALMNNNVTGETYTLAVHKDT
jgi:hypothetical protein